jgi:branched-chain amino acid transport system permease protein
MTVSRGFLVNVAVVLVTAAVVGWVGTAMSDYHLRQGAGVGVYFAAILGLNILTGYTGQISIGHGAFMALGGYTTAILATHHGWNDLTTIPIAALVGFGAGVIVGLPALRLSGVYLALLTFAAALAVPQLAKNYSTFTGGTQGLPLPSHTGAWLYYASWTLAAILFVLAWLILRGRTGRAFRAVRDSEVAASSSGVSLPIFKILAFGISGGFAGVAGAMYVLDNNFVNPDIFGLTLSLYILIGAAVGGLGSLWGVLVGAVFVQLLPTALSTTHVLKAQEAAPVIFGLILVVVMIVFPRGAAVLLRAAVRPLTAGVGATSKSDTRGMEG